MTLETQVGFGGLSGDAVRRCAASLPERRSADPDRCRRLVAAMGQLAHDLDRVAALLAQARDTARARRLVVEGTTILVPGTCADPDQHRSWRELRAVVAGIRELETRARREWQQAIARDAGALAAIHPSEVRSSGGPRVPGPLGVAAFEEVLDEPA